MIEIAIYRDPLAEPKEVARVTIEGDVVGESPTANSLRERIEDPRDPIIGDYTDGRDLLRYLVSSYSNGYVMASYDSEESRRIVEDVDDEAYRQWVRDSDLDTRL